MDKILSIKHINVYKQKVFLRVDLDVPLKNGKIADDSRLKAWFPTLLYLLKNQAKVFLAGHLGRPNGFEEKFTLKPVLEWIKNELNFKNEIKIIDLNGFKSWEISDSLYLLENLRFFNQEEANDQEFAKKLSQIANIYVNDAFASSHRSHASIVGIPHFLPHFGGFRLMDEIKILGNILQNPKRPFGVIIGGAKIETKLPLVESMHSFADYVLVGGEIAENTKILLKVQHEKIKNRKSALIVADLNSDNTDITSNSAENFLQISKNCETLVWNGPMGLVEKKESSQGTRILAKGLAKLSNYRIVGGGDTLVFLKELNLLNHFDFASTGGGAMLEFLARVNLPGLIALEK